LQSHEIFLCRYAFGLVEANEEKIEWASIELHVDSSIVYGLWPTESYKPRSSLSVDVNISSKIGLTKTLEVIELPVSGSVNVVWQKKWQWMSAMIKAWGVGDSTAAWEMQRDTSAPFAGDRELYLMLQLQRGEKPVKSLASFKAKINPKGWARSFEYNNEQTGPIHINYHIA
jgi:hypothetical protein